ncbi:MAG: phosphonate ABC transporter, permease protein PhnE [candidate division NC10 bacterium]|nr:phosphonate ABC transporter, permease protein PhnE [candidate division NC10 bacterium]
MSGSIDREWQRFTPGHRVLRYGVYLATAVAFGLALRHIEVVPEFLADTPTQVADLLVRMWPVDWTFLVSTVIGAMVETVHIATLGTLATLVIAFPVGVLAARNIVANPAVRFGAKLLLVASRSVNSLVWALFFVAVFGPGALAGTVAITCRSIGFVGKLLGEALEEAAPGPVEAMTAVGAPWPSVFLKGYWPQVKPAFFSIALLRWDINVRESSVLGLVGAGGIGLVLDSAINVFQWRAVAAILMAILAIVLLAEVAVTAIRKRVL